MLAASVITGVAACTGKSGNAQPELGASRPDTDAGTLPKNLAAPASLRTDLLYAFASLKKTPTREFTGPVAGTLYYAYVPASGSYWAIAQFEPSAQATFQTKVNMQDGGNIGVFMRRAGTPWHVALGGIPFPCPGAIPQNVLALWSISYAQNCPSAHS